MSGTVANHARQIFFGLPAQMLGQLRNGGRKFSVAFYSDVFHHGRLTALQERANGFSGNR